MLIPDMLFYLTLHFSDIEQIMCIIKRTLHTCGHSHLTVRTCVRFGSGRPCLELIFACSIMMRECRSCGETHQGQASDQLNRELQEWLDRSQDGESLDNGQDLD